MWCGVASQPSQPPPYVPRSLMVESHVPCSVYFGEGGDRMGNGFCCPQQSCPGIHLRVIGRGWGGGYPSRAVGPTGIGATVSLPGVLSGVGAARNKLGNDGWEAVKAPTRLRRSAALPPRRRRGSKRAFTEEMKCRSALQLLLHSSNSPRKKNG